MRHTTISENKCNVYIPLRLRWESRRSRFILFPAIVYRTGIDQFRLYSPSLSLVQLTVLFPVFSIVSGAVPSLALCSTDIKQLTSYFVSFFFFATYKARDAHAWLYRFIWGWTDGKHLRIFGFISTCQPGKTAKRWNI